MKTKTLLITVLTLLSFLLINIANAKDGTHLSYEYLGAGSTPGTQKYKLVAKDQYNCNYSFFRVPDTLHGLAYCSASNQKIDIKIPIKKHVYAPGEKIAPYSQRNISHLCTKVKSICEDKTERRFGGYFEIRYETVIELPACSEWMLHIKSTFGGSTRNNVNRYRYVAWATLNNNNGKSNSTAELHKKLYHHVNFPVNRDITYALGINDPDGDSLSYQFANGILNLDGTTQTYTHYIAPATYQSPIPGIKLDSINGHLTFKLTTNGIFCVEIQITEYDRKTKQKKGSNVHYLTIVAWNLGGNLLPYETGGISNLTGATKLSKYLIKVDEGITANWSDTIYDPNANDSLNIFSNIDSVLPGATYSVNYLSGNRVVVNYQWTGQQYKQNKFSYFTKYDDNVCGYPGLGVVVHQVELIPSPVSLEQNAEQYQSKIFCYPNPVVDNLKIEIRSPKEGYATIKIMSLNGQVLVTKQVSFSAGISEQTLNTNKLVTGTYLVQFKENNQEIVKRIIVH